MPSSPLKTAWLLLWTCTVLAVTQGVLGTDLGNEKEMAIRELGLPLRMKPFGKIRTPSLRNIRYRGEEQQSYYSVEISSEDANLMFQLSYYLKISDEATTRRAHSCGFKYKFNNTVFPVLVKRGELLGSLVCEGGPSPGKLPPEQPVLAFCYGQVQLAYPFLPLSIILLRDEDLFLVQLCARKFPDHRGTPYRFPTIPPNQITPFNNTLFEVSRLENSESRLQAFAYYIKAQKPHVVADCFVNKLFHGKSFQATYFFIIGVVSCKIKAKGQKTQVVREVVRALCNGISTFQPRDGSPDSHLFGTFKASPKSPFSITECVSPPEDILDKRLMNPDQAIKDAFLQMSDE